MKEIKGNYQGKGKRIAIIVSRFNEMIGTKLLEGCIDELGKQGTDERDITVIWTPGSFEIPQVLAKLCTGKKYHAFITLGAVIRGETPHFEYVASELAKGIANLSIENKVPVIMGTILADTVEQALERAGTKQGNRGRTAALSAIEMADLYTQL
ncbi:MAG: 6,7-dimethyl-8-ribityllumazine synthase [Candidatus Omnitrophica bacterium]|nr:6,7-dimethyl-8-ribityllumazine synthase [Candidatus Omnitrophota bacterium]